MIDLVKSAHEVLDVEIAAVTMEEAVALCASMAESGRPHCIATANAEMLMIARKDGELKHILQRCDLVVPDGAGILWAGEQLHTPFPERVTGADLTERLLLLAEEKQWPVYFLGGAPGVAAEAAAHFRAEKETSLWRESMTDISTGKKRKRSYRRSGRAAPGSFWWAWAFRSRKNG